MLSQKPLTPAIEESRRATGNVFLDNYVLDFLNVPETPIPYRFLDTESFADLFLYPKQQKLYAVVLTAGINQQYKINIYSLRYPPLKISEIMQKEDVYKRQLVL